MMEDDDEGRKARRPSYWVEVAHLPVSPKNGKALTNGKALPNGNGLTSGPGMVNGLAYTSQTMEMDAERRPTGFHIYSEEVSTRPEEHMPRGFGVRMDLINGFSIEKERPSWKPPKKHWWSPRGRRASKSRMAKMAEGPMPGEDTV